MGKDRLLGVVDENKQPSLASVGWYFSTACCTTGEMLELTEERGVWEVPCS
jgi:hypothetical protein